jgi:hypothetical protein
VAYKKGQCNQVSKIVCVEDCSLEMRKEFDHVELDRVIDKFQGWKILNFDSRSEETILNMFRVDLYDLGIMLKFQSDCDYH